MKGKALYPKMDVLFSMMREILMESRLDDEKRLKEILAMLKSRLQMSFLSSGHTTAALRALSYTSPMAKFKDDTDGIGFYEVVREDRGGLRRAQRGADPELKRDRTAHLPCG